MKLPSIEENRAEFDRHEKMLEEYFAWAKEALADIDPDLMEKFGYALSHIENAVLMSNNLRIEIQGLRWQTEVQAHQIDSLRSTIDRIQDELVEKEMIENPAQYDIDIPPNLISMTAEQKRKWIDMAINKMLYGNNAESNQSA